MQAASDSRTYDRYKQIAEEISNEDEREFVLNALMFGYLTATWMWWMKEERNNADRNA